MKLKIYKAGIYEWKNGIEVKKIKRNKWIVTQYGKTIFTGITLGMCKNFIWSQYPEKFTY